MLGKQVDGARAYPHPGDPLPAKRSCIPARTWARQSLRWTGLQRHYQAPWQHGFLLSLVETMETTRSLSFPYLSIRRNTNLAKSFAVHLAEMSIKIRLWSRRHLLWRGVPRVPTNDKAENTSDPGLSLRAAMKLQPHSRKSPTSYWVLEAVHRTPKVTPLRLSVGKRGWPEPWI